MTHKKILRPFLMALAVAFLCSCTGGRMSKNMVVYVNQDIMNISQLEILALKHYSSVTGDHYTSDQKLCSVLKNDVIPLYKRFYALLREISPEDPELKRVHMIYVQGAGEILNGFKAKRIGLEKQDDGLIRLANRQIEEGGKTVAEWRMKLYQLITENKSVKMKS
jgi:hypothetical protein